jgi:hypothetical protein
MDERLIVNSHGEFRMLRNVETQNFVCDRCLRPKTAKVVVKWDNKNSGSKSICNSCFSFLVFTAES